MSQEQPSTGDGGDNPPEHPVEEPIEVLEIPTIRDEDRPQTAPLTDKVRARLAQGFAVLLAVTILLAFISIWAGVPWADVKDLLNVVLPAETALLGSAFGFYFGSQKNGK